MAKGSGKDAVFKIDNSAGTLIDLSVDTDEVTLTRPVELYDVTAFGDGGEKTTVGIKVEAFTAKGSHDAAAGRIAPHLNGIYGQTATVSFEIGPQGSTAGNEKFTGEARLESYEISTPVRGKIAWSANFRVDGVATRGTY